MWFSKVWAYLAKTEKQSRPDPNCPVRPLGSSPDSRFLRVRTAFPSSAPSHSAHPPASPSPPAGQAYSAAAAPPSPQLPMDVDDVQVDNRIFMDGSAAEVLPPSPQLQAPVPMVLDSAEVQQHAAPQPEPMEIDLEMLLALRKETRSAVVLVDLVTGQVVKE